MCYNSNIRIMIFFENYHGFSDFASKKNIEEVQIMNYPKYVSIRDDLMFKTVFSDERLLRELLKRVLPDIDITD